MSPRRRIQPDEEPLLAPTSAPWSRLSLRRKLARQWWKPSRNWALPAAAAAATVLTAGAIATSSLVLVDQRSHHQAAMKEVDVLGFVQSFMTGFTTLDPFHANAYVDRILADATGDFAKQYRDKENDILVQIAQAEPTKGTALAAGVERWNDDGSANVMVATEVTFKSPDGKQTLDNTNRWVVTAQREGSQWKISSLQQVI
ncbi:MAG: mammalian cell entry protein [Mycobacterium sp.]|nr:mammalian cell entry protein [Mycobacterium sp.]MBV9722973.1 mammalian cell entry protein [Mycobacterium sp.]